MSTIEVKVPDIGDFKDVPVIEVLVKLGDVVKADDPLVTLESDKATMEVPSPAAGTVRELKVKLGDKVAEGVVILTLESAAAGAPSAATPAAQPAVATAAAPAAAASPPATSAPIAGAAMYSGKADLECEMLVLGTDGFGRSDTRERLRSFFEVDRFHVVVAALKALADDGVLPPARAAEAMRKYGIDGDRPAPWTV